MDQLGLLGVSWRNATAATIAQFTLPREDRSTQLRELAAVLETEELVYLATCNRVELLVAGGASLSIAERRRRLHAHFTGRSGIPGAAEQHVRAWEGEGAVEHLFLVASGLESARAGESEITGQLRCAVAEAEAAGLLGLRLRAVLEDAFRVAKRLRPITEGRIGRASLADVAVARVRARLQQQPGAVALVGVSPMTERCAAGLARLGVPLIVVNRTSERAALMAAPLGATARSLDAFRGAPDALSAMIVATGAPEPVLDREALARIAAAAGPADAPLIVDLGVPANVAGDDATRLGMPYFDMDAITRAAEQDREAALHELGEARAMVDEALAERRQRRWESLVNPAIVELRRRMAIRARDELDRALNDELASLDSAERAALRRWTDTLVRRLAHVPTRGLRDLAGRAGPAAAAAYLGGAAPDLAAELRTRLASVPAADVAWGEDVA